MTAPGENRTFVAVMVGVTVLLVIFTILLAVFFFWSRRVHEEEEARRKEFIVKVQNEPGTGVGKVAEFELVSDSDKPFGSKELAGKVWIADFIFTRCAGPCPEMTKLMSRLQKRVPESVMLVSFSVDPEFDTPYVLSKYAAEYDADLKRWVFLTGEREKIFRIAKDSFHLAVAEGAGGIQDLTHSVRFALVDRDGTIVNTYDSCESTQIDKLVADATDRAGKK